VVVLAALVAVGFTMGRSYSVPSPSMEPTYGVGSHVYATKFGHAARGQVVIIRRPAAQSAGPPQAMRRIVAVGGDTVTAQDGRLLVNGRLADEPYLAHGTKTQMGAPVTVPKGKVFVMGDDRPISQDSRFYGPLPTADIIGYVRFGWG
jgi:signal peptidase I